jgi:hypothetical protein
VVLNPCATVHEENACGEGLNNTEQHNGSRGHVHGVVGRIHCQCALVSKMLYEMLSGVLARVPSQLCQGLPSGCAGVR